ncbi:unnamed protein product [Candidula unifasciata]|uniref:BZIP domain-containing protein n=1 Tax=Candidula unifasciata TaxID=100452 RepID=A0A8S3YKX9_9EUPU|nr:unnamed protein product [Candidula unifasciata]
MELDMWNDDLLAGDWSLPVDHSGGLFDDLKSEGCLCGNDPLSLQLQDAVERVRSESPSRNEDILGTEWMESSDLGSLLEVMGNSRDKLLPLDAGLIEYTYSIAPDEPVTFVEPIAEHNSKLYKNAALYSSIENFLSAIPITDQSPGISTSKVSFDAFLSPPSSPEQVAPVVKAEPIDITTGVQARTLSLCPDTAQLFGEEFSASVGEGDPIFNGLEVTFDDATEFISSPLSADDVDSMLSSVPTSPSNSSHSSSIIESSPELYRVILTSTIEDTKRFSPYSKPKASKQTKGSGRNRTPTEPVTDHIIGEELSKKDRKKLQNKNAAIRYRMKKKEEAVGIKSEEQELEEANQELKGKVDDLQREIKYMKNLMEEVLRAKGLM